MREMNAFFHHSSDNIPENKLLISTSSFIPATLCMQSITVDWFLVESTRFGGRAPLKVKAKMSSAMG